MNVSYTDIRDRVTRYLGWPDHGDWGAEETSDWEAILEQGQRQFYWPPSLPTPETDRKQQQPVTAPPYGWTFLREVEPLSIGPGTTDYALPVNFGQLVGRLTGVGFRPIEIVTAERMRAMLATSPPAGSPKYATIRTLPYDPTVGTLKQVTFAPEPDASYTVDVPYAIIPPTIDESNPYPVGGVLHGETILQSCLAAAEVRMHGEEAMHVKRFYDRLQASIRMDREAAGR